MKGSRQKRQVARSLQQPEEDGRLPSNGHVGRSTRDEGQEVGNKQEANKIIA